VSLIKKLTKSILNDKFESLKLIYMTCDVFRQIIICKPRQKGYFDLKAALQNRIKAKTYL
jgi:hypothetical protein